MNYDGSPRFGLDRFDFRDLFVLDMANNHQGSVEHGLNIVRAVAEPVRRHAIRAGVKFQFRQLASFVHPSHREGSDNKHIPRVLSTELKRPDYEKLLKEVRANDMLAILRMSKPMSTIMSTEGSSNGVQMPSMSCLRTSARSVS